VRGTWDSERDPLAALRRGDSSLFEEFVRTETGTLLAFFLRQGAGSAEAEDLVQDVLLRLYDHSSSYEPRERFGAFAFRIARNAWIDRRRRIQARPAHRSLDAGQGEGGVADRLEDGAESAGEILSRGEEADRLRRALARLPEPHRLVFELGVLQELGYHDIAAALEIPVGTVKSRMFHAVRKLRRALEAEPAGEGPAREEPARGEAHGQREGGRS
jgi:RNA polymerase sigma-70 factor (ECF subfamily)